MDNTGGECSRRLELRLFLVGDGPFSADWPISSVATDTELINPFKPKFISRFPEFLTHHDWVWQELMGYVA